MRQDYSVRRIVELMAFHDDADGLATASKIPNEQLLEYLIGLAQANMVDMDRVVDLQLRAFEQNHRTNEHLKALEKISLDDRQRRRIIRWGEKFFKSGPESATAAASLLIQMDCVDKSIVPELVKLWADQRGAVWI